MNTVFHIDFKNKKLIEKVSDGVPDVDNFIVNAPTAIGPVDKYTYFSKLIDTGLIQILINPKLRGTKLPLNLKKEAFVALNWSHKFNIKDFEYDDKGVRGTLTFNAKDCFVNIPWKSIWAIFLTKSPKETMKIWEADIPREISLSDFIQEDK